MTNNISKELYYLGVIDNLKNNLLILKCFAPEEQDKVLVDLLENIARKIKDE